MRVVILTPSFLPAYNGMTFATLQHASMLTDLGHHVTVVASCPCEHRDEVAATLSERGMSFLPAGLAGSGLISRPVVGDVGSLVECVAALEPNVVVVEARFFWGYHLIPVFKQRGLTVALISHGSPATRFAWSVRWVLKTAAYVYYALMYERRILRAVDGVAVLSAHEDNERFRDARLYRQLGFSPIVVANTSIESAAAQVRKVGGEPGKLRIAVVGDMSPLKNQLAAVGIAQGNDAVSFVRFYFPAETEYSRMLASRARAKGIANFQYRTGLDREAIIRSLGDIDLMLCLSTTEAQPLSIIDGLACGLPFLSTPVGCLPSMKGGVVSDIPGMRGVIRQLAGDAGAMEDLAREARVFFEMAHSESAVKPALAALITAAVRKVR
jgi:glycosyltransferase involved in cell wall biosynthesis